MCVCVCVQGVAPHNHRGGGKLTGIIARCCPSFPKIASISRERPRSPPEQLVRHGGSSWETGRERKRGRNDEGERRKRHRWSDKKEAHTPDQRETTDGPAECTCWNKGLANRRRWKLKRTHRHKNVHAQVAENIITVPFLGVSINVAGWRRARSRFLKTISFTASGMRPSISSFWIPRDAEKGFYIRDGGGEGAGERARSISETS